ncbi:MAG: cytochrome c oxidase accessory protein CcoG [Arenicellales bacterium]|nr:cytochrome c oxidase accessory protein CcoG [Arenicellales bacterium]
MRAPADNTTTPAASRPFQTSKDKELEQALYEKRQKIYPREVHGLFARLRLSGVATLMGIFYFTPWIVWDGRQAILFDLPGRKFYIFGLTFWPQDLIYLSALLILAALSLFFFTALAGRLWCGYACPQTVWTEVFLWIERKIEGDRMKQIKLDKAPWSSRKLAIKAAKHGSWIVLSLWTGYTFTGYFTPIRDLAVGIMTLNLGPWETFWVLFYGFATYGNAGWLREQVCIYMCPYARFQSAMFDKDTLIISYDGERGEPRGSRKRSADPSKLGLGDCIDCTMCVQACPTGIDIRNGLQYQCIGCAACIDACNDVMDRMGYDRGLVRYTTEHALSGEHTKIARPRVLIYAGILLVLLITVVYSIAVRTPAKLDIIRDRNTLYRETGEGLIENVYTLRILNKDDESHNYVITIEGLPEMQLLMDKQDIAVEAGAVKDVTARIQIDPVDIKSASNEITFHLAARDKPEIAVSETARFVGPSGGP